MTRQKPSSINHWCVRCTGKMRKTKLAILACDDNENIFNVTCAHFKTSKIQYNTSTQMKNAKTISHFNFPLNLCNFLFEHRKCHRRRSIENSLWQRYFLWIYGYEYVVVRFVSTWYESLILGRYNKNMFFEQFLR